jgi:2-dehydro-3-deoxy-D-arabinonate dehydratase
MPALDADAMAPLEGQEVWAAGVTYIRSRAARMEESHGSGAEGFYDAVYDAPRPELFFKASPWRVRGPGEYVRIRGDARWSVPEPELALCVNAAGTIVGWTIGNDMSSRDIEGENPLYLPQAKIYDGSCALGPALLVREGPLPPDTVIAITIRREGQAVFEGDTMLSRMRRTPEELVEYLYRETSFPLGCILLTGTGVVPPNDFTLRSGDEIAIHVGAIGTLVNRVE